MPNCCHLHGLLVRGHSTLLVVTAVSHGVSAVSCGHVGRVLTVHPRVVGVLHGRGGLVAVVVPRTVVSIICLCVIVPSQEFRVHVGP